ncbi:MAG: 16S rRNA (cytosine(1402)-N(4))-methyltransferase RsmH [Chloroflexi bacterium]|nr:16S rRNA (cytosine(1402)-N(4))-methyltransferase RsmH [Chloroflexota bacterium]
MNGSNIGGGTLSDSPGDRFPHQPVLYHQVLEALAPVSSGVYLDGTLGAGGHAMGILQASAPRGRLLGLDLDLEALAMARQRLFAFRGRTILQQASYHLAAQIVSSLGWAHLDGILLDLGVSSMQIDQAGRGFSFQEDGPLDMRFDQSESITAAELINILSQEALTKILRDYGEERFATRIARAIIKARPIHTTLALATLIKTAVPGYEKNLHPATRTFQALRIATNRELENLAQALPSLVSILAPGGRIAVISFHSLEDRIVKQFFKVESSDCICPPEQLVCTCGHVATIKVLTRKPIRPDAQEVAGNPRARSARLRVAEKLKKA